MDTTMPGVPKGQENFFYASKTCLWIFFKVKLDVLKAKFKAELHRLGLEIATFEDHTHGYVALVPMVYTALFGAQNTKEKRPGVAGITEAEFNILVYPSAQKALVPKLSFKEFVLGWEQQKVIGQHRLAVICDHIGAVYGGREKYGEHKFPGDIDYNIDTFNNNPAEAKALSLYFKACPSGAAGSSENYVFSLDVNLQGLTAVVSDFSPVVVYGAIPPEPGKTVRQQTVGSRRNYLGMHHAYFPEPNKNSYVALKYGSCREAPVLNDLNGIPVENSQNWAREMGQMMKAVLSDAGPAGFLYFESAPAVTEPRPYFVNYPAGKRD